jgi:fibronectin type 3 domain-containing protein
VQAGCAQVTGSTKYSFAQGYGWQSGSIGSVDRGVGTDLARDMNYTSSGVFAADLPNGTYQVTLTLGDLWGFAHDQMGISLEGQQVDTVSTAAWQVVNKTYLVTVADGQLTLGLLDLGGTDPAVAIEGLRVQQVVDVTYDFGTATSAVAAGCTQVTGSTRYSLAQGFGWQSGSIGNVERGVGTDLTRDMNYTGSGVFAADLPNGTYQVTLMLGDAWGFAHDQMGISLEGQQVDTVDTAAWQVVTRTYTVTVTDGQLNLGLQDLGGTDPAVAIEGMRIVTTTDAAPAAASAASARQAIAPRAVDGIDLAAVAAQALGSRAGLQGIDSDWDDIAAGVLGSGARRSA